MLLFVRRKGSPAADEKMLLRLRVQHEFMHSNKIEDIQKRVCVPEKRKRPQSQRKAVKHIMFDLNFVLEQSDTELYALLEQLKRECPDTGVTFYYFAEDEYLVGRGAESIKELGYTQFLIAENEGDYLKKLNAFILENGLHPAESVKDGCTTIGVMGGCQRIGATTQAMQIMMFLQKNGHRAGLIQWNSAPELRGYVDDIKGAKYLNESEFVIKGLRFYGPRDVKTALNDNDYLIFDFGNIGKMEDDCIEQFLQKDIRIAVLGMKSSEIRYFPEIFGFDTKGDIRYICSFILQSSRDTVRAAMGPLKKQTYFAEYTPDYFTYGEDDALYSKMLDVTIPQKPPQKKIADIVKSQFERIQGAFSKQNRE